MIVDRSATSFVVSGSRTLAKAIFCTLKIS